MPAQPVLPYGGQAVIEGVMMRGSRSLAVAVRAPDQRIVVRTRPLGRIYRGRLSRIPFLRGLLGIWDAVGLGWQSLSYSASVAIGQETQFEGPAAWGAMAASLVLGLSVFLFAPAGLAQLGDRWLRWGSLWSNVAEGLLRLAMVLAYLWLIGLLPEVQRLFGYHGAEHKTIRAFEAGADLTPASVARFPLEHPRCGTAFLLTVVVFSIVLFALLGPLPWWARLGSRLLLIPVVAGVAFEYVRITAQHMDNPVVRLLVLPNLALQRLTTRQPDEHMLEVAIAAFQAMRAGEDQPHGLLTV